jgi:hypothetical protein
MRVHKRAAAGVFIGLFLVMLAACGEGQKVGSEKLLEFNEQQGAGRLGERTAAPTGTPLTVGGRTPQPTPKAQPTAGPTFFEISLVKDSPYYKPGARLTVRVGVTIRVTNNDTTAERAEGRSFTEKNGLFHSGLLKAGQQWTWVFRSQARYEIIDQGLTFATATLDVVP